MFLALEFGIARLAPGLLPLEEVFEGSGHIHECTLNRTLGHLIGPGKLLFANGIEVLFERLRIRLATCLVLSLPLGQRAG